MLRQRPPIYKVPNEILTYIAEDVGPPDLARADPGWLVFPAVCKWWRDVAEKMPTWKSGSTEDADGLQTIYARVDLLPEHPWASLNCDLIEVTDTTLQSVMEEKDDMAVFCGIRPIWKDGTVDCSNGFFAALCAAGDQEHRRHLTEYLSSTRLPKQLPVVNFAWMSYIRLSCSRRGAASPDPDYFFADVPCIVAPALRKLHLDDYIVDWRCDGLECLQIVLRRIANSDNPTRYFYPPARLLARLSESRHTLGEVELYNCFPSVSRDLRYRSTLSVIDFPCVTKFIIYDDPRAASWFCRRVGLPPGIRPAFMAPWPDSEVPFLRSVACEHAQHMLDDQESRTHSSHGVIEILSFHEAVDFIDGDPEAPSRCSVKGYAPSMIVTDAVPRLDSNSTNVGRPAVASPPGTRGSEPAFVIYASWDADAWSLPTIPYLPTCCSALSGVKDVFIAGGEGLFSSGRNSSATWVEILQHLPSLRRLYIDNPTDRSLVPLASLDLVPALETLWLRGSGEGTYDVDVRWPAYILHERKMSQASPECAFAIRLENVRLVGDATLIQKWRELGGEDCV